MIVYVEESGVFIAPYPMQCCIDFFFWWSMLHRLEKPMIFLSMFLVFFFVFNDKLEVIDRSCQLFEEPFILLSFESLQFSFYSKSCNSIDVLSIFIEKSCKPTKQGIIWTIEDMKIEDQWFLKNIWR